MLLEKEENFSEIQEVSETKMRAYNISWEKNLIQNYQYEIYLD